MNTVRVIKPFKRRGEIILPDSILEVADEVLTKLVGLVEAIPCDGVGHPDLHLVLGKWVTRIEKVMSPSPPSFLNRLSASDKVWLRDNVRQIDAAVLAGDRGGLETFLAEREGFLWDRRSQQQERAVTAPKIG
jgi:hypothetical protein